MRNDSKPKYKMYSVVWSNIRRHQYLLGMTDKQLCDLLGVTERTLYSYDKNPSVITLEKVESFLVGTGIEMQSLISV